MGRTLAWRRGDRGTSGSLATDCFPQRCHHEAPTHVAFLPRALTLLSMEGFTSPPSCNQQKAV